MFWNNFYNICRLNNTSPNAVCAELGLSTATATHWKNGTLPKADVLVRIADYFGVSVDYILGRTSATTEINSRNTITGTYNVIGNNSQVSIEGELSTQEQELILCFRKLSEVDKAKFLLSVAEISN